MQYNLCTALEHLTALDLISRLLLCTERPKIIDWKSKAKYAFSFWMKLKYCGATFLIQICSQLPLYTFMISCELSNNQRVKTYLSWLRFSKNRPLADSFIESRCPSVCLSLYICDFFQGLSLALRSHDQIPASHWSTLLPYHMVVVGGGEDFFLLFYFL